MRIIPVIDIRNGAVVRAIAGRRDDYLPLQSPLTTPAGQSAEPIPVARGLMALYPFDRLYIADLDAIEGRRDNRDAIRAIGACFPSLELWVDSGVRVREAARWRNQDNLRLVLGSESLPSVDALRDFEAREDCVLSLDFREPGFLGDPEILDNAALWPSRVIVMSLSRVGGDAGPDVARVKDVVARAGAREVYGAGGVRCADDVSMLARIGASGVLVSSALHNGGLTVSDLENFAALSAHKKEGEPAGPP
jgi:phosphoribosylformimino-5-aminoimidazole carboxamide ribotide isomerase